MIKFAFVATNGEVRSIVHPSDDALFQEGQVVGDDILRAFDYAVPDMAVMEGWYWQDGWVKTKPERPSIFHRWENFQWALDTVDLEAEIRELRDSKLFRTDWTQSPDSPLSDAAKIEWAAYRQALRDVPANNTTVTSLDEVSWPTPPGG